MLIIIVLNLIILKGMRKNKNEVFRKKMSLFNIFKMKLLK